MGCNCSPSRRKNKGHIIELAEKFALMEQVDVEVYYEHVKGDTDLHYDFQEKGREDKGAAVVKTIEFRKLKSKNILPDPKRTGGGKKASGGSIGAARGKTTGGSKQDKPKVAKSTKPPGRSNAGNTDKTVAKDS